LPKTQRVLGEIERVCIYHSVEFNDAVHYRTGSRLPIPWECHPIVVYGQESCESIQVKKGVDLKYPKSEKSIFLKTLNTRFFLDNG
jgi:hypothetical protein